MFLARSQAEATPGPRYQAVALKAPFTCQQILLESQATVVNYKTKFSAAWKIYP